MYTDKIIKCKDCGNEFTFTASAQQFYAEKGYKHEPTRCKDCRAKKKEAGAYRTQCVKCGDWADLPFIPKTTAGQGFLCKKCYIESKQLELMNSADPERYLFNKELKRVVCLSDHDLITDALGDGYIMVGKEFALNTLVEKDGYSLSHNYYENPANLTAHFFVNHDSKTVAQCFKNTKAEDMLKQNGFTPLDSTKAVDLVTTGYAIARYPENAALVKDEPIDEYPF